MRVSFDFDDTLLSLGFDVDEMEFYELGPNEKILNKLRSHVKKGDDVFVVTSRQWTQSSQDEIEDLLKQADNQGYFAIDTETNSLNSFKPELVGVSLAVTESKAYYIPVGHKNKEDGNIQKQIKIKDLINI